MEEKLVKVELVKGLDYTVFDKTFKKNEAVAVTAQEAEYLLKKTDGSFKAVVVTVDPEVEAKAKADAEAKAKAIADAKAKAEAEAKAKAEAPKK